MGEDMVANTPATLFLETRVFFSPCGSPNRLDRPPIPQATAPESRLSPVPSAGIISMYYHTWLVSIGSRDQTHACMVSTETFLHP